MKIKSILGSLLLFAGMAFGQSQFSGGGGGANLPAPGGTGLCFVSTGAGSGQWGWSSCSGSAASWTTLTGGTNTTSAFVVGAGASLDFTSTGTINASSLGGATFAAPGVIGGTTPAAATFTTLSVTTYGSGAMSGTYSGNPTFSGTPVFNNLPTFPSATANFFLAAPNGSSGSPTMRAIVAADIPTLNQSTSGNAATATAVPWSGLTTPGGNLALSNGSNTSIFSTTTAVSQFFAWKNTTAALVGTSQSSPINSLCGTEWHAAASTEGCFTLQFIPGTGTDAANTLSFGHTGSATGVTSAQFPGPVASGNDAVHAGYFSLVGNTANPSITANTVGILGPTTASFTAYGLQFPSTAPSGTQYLGCGTPSSSVSACSWNTITGAVSSVNTLTGAVVIEAATAGQMAVSGGSGAALTGAADMTYSTHAFATTTAGIFDWSAATGTNAFKFPAVIGGTFLGGTSTANLSAPIVIQNTNSTNNNTSITMGVSAPGTSTGQTVLNVNGAATGADLADFGTGGTWANGVLSGQTVVDAFTANGTMKLGAAPTVTTPGTGFYVFGTEGTEPASIASGTTGFVTDSTSHCPVVWDNAVNMGCVPSSLTRQITGADWSCGTGGTVSSCVAAGTIGTLTWTLPLVAANWSMDCTLIVGQATGVTANNWNLQTATNGATNVEADYSQETAATAIASGVTTGQASTTTTFNIGGTWTQGATGTKMPVHIHATIEGASVSGTVVNLQLVAPTVADLVTIYRGSSCTMSLKQ